MTIVTAAIIIKDNKVLIAKRAKNEKQAGKWEFPGGKLEPNESLKDCLIRELKEELNISIEIVDYFGESRYDYAQGFIKLIGYYVKWTGGEPRLTVHDEIRWVDKNDLANYDFAPADIPFVKMLE